MCDCLRSIKAFASNWDGRDSRKKKRKIEELNQFRLVASSNGSDTRRIKTNYQMKCIGHWIGVCITLLNGGNDAVNV